MLILICVDAIGDSIIFKGIHEFSQALVSGHTWNYSLLPGTNILKIVLFRFDISTVILGLASGLILLFRMANLYVHPLYLVGVIFALILGIATHMTLSTFYFLIQGYFDPKMAIIRGNPNVKLYTKPLALLWNGSFALVFIKRLYPVYFATAFAHELVTKSD